ncbi:DUF6147 family protein [Luxibacter massiliensis]|uniref:DUF6147 family protein n=1 Tax=Luxibacter massiliensis TaxID=2219695 RepID=UPI000F061240|nr:DUF6147 family protein [Luxibacter massiliensis]
MKKRILSAICTMGIMFSVFSSSVVNTNAMQIDNSPIQIDGSYLTNNDTASATTKSEMTRGIHLMDGDCSITKAGKGRIYVYASTTANHTVDYVSTVIYVDQYNEETEKWDQIDFWQVEDEDTYYVATSKTMKVDSGYYYRVHADHVAGMKDTIPYDRANTATDGIFVN